MAEHVKFEWRVLSTTCDVGIVTQGRGPQVIHGRGAAFPDVWSVEGGSCAIGQAVPGDCAQAVRRSNRPLGVLGKRMRVLPSSIGIRT